MLAKHTLEKKNGIYVTGIQKWVKKGLILNITRNNANIDK